MGFKTILAIIIIVFLLVLGAFAIENRLEKKGDVSSPPLADAITSDTIKDIPSVNETPENNPDSEPVISEPKTSTITIAAGGFSPSTIVISAGDSILFLNDDSSEHWPASDKHPSHKNYPGSDIKKCGTSEEDTIFDSCGGLSQGETYKFKFNYVGTWEYHDHLKPGLTGTIEVV
ncbi:hypothetical protein HYS72_01445 [Candidatus Pacearchaeota archaeon]|nr:hypothetical protein [Candidatus Pacearchaeota archaeon]